MRTDTEGLLARNGLLGILLEPAEGAGSSIHCKRSRLSPVVRSLHPRV